ncbi:hypothetical protein EMPS_06520 [Entomortierella parvispora]|uniref:F-box domain-containing protein n=1 Tax=Entomortierella parvispora TaxID=205924 RepID=A0A9P3HD45_9FUNG|nr:hypothetical protein EMPS_06520 [Entomortierella parvispora]
MDLPPEIRPLIGQYLTPKDAITCMKVSKSWFDSFSIWAFREVSILSRPDYFHKNLYKDPCKSRLPPRGWLQKYGSSIQVLLLGSYELRLYLFSTVDSQEQRQKDGEQAIVLFPRMREIYLYASSLKAVEPWLLHCPRLKVLCWNHVVGPHTADIDVNSKAASTAQNKVVSLSQHCPMLNNLDIIAESSEFLEVDDPAGIVSHCPPSLTEFSLAGDEIHPWFEALSHALDRITVLDLYACQAVEGWMFKRIVCSCPSLVELHWHIYDADELFSEKDVGRALAVDATTAAYSETGEEEDERTSPWACTGLQKLYFCYVAWSDCSEKNKAAMEHLGLLKVLKCFTVEEATCPRSDEDWGRFMSSFPWPEERCVLSGEDLKKTPGLEWIRKTWPLLECFELQGWN